MLKPITKRARIINFVASKRYGARYTDIIKFIWEFNHPGLQFNSKECRGYYSTSFTTHGNLRVGSTHLVKRYNFLGQTRYFVNTIVKESRQYNDGLFNSGFYHTNVNNSFMVNESVTKKKVITSIPKAEPKVFECPVQKLINEQQAEISALVAKLNGKQLEVDTLTKTLESIKKAIE